MTKYKALVEADAIVVSGDWFESKEEAEEYFEDNVDTGHLGPPKVKTVQENAEE